MINKYKLHRFKLINILSGNVIKYNVPLTQKDASIFNYAFALNNAKKKYILS